MPTDPKEFVRIEADQVGGSSAAADLTGTTLAENVVNSSLATLASDVSLGSVETEYAGLTATATSTAYLQLSGDPGGTAVASFDCIDVTALNISVQKPDVSPGPLGISCSEIDLSGNVQQIKVRLNNVLGTIGQVPTSDAAGAVTWSTGPTVGLAAKEYADDAAAATGGVAVGELYHTAGALKVRLT